MTRIWSLFSARCMGGGLIRSTRRKEKKMNKTQAAQKRQALTQSVKASFPYTIECRRGVDGWFVHSYIQTLTDERVFVEHANSEAEYRIRASQDRKCDRSEE